MGHFPYVLISNLYIELVYVINTTFYMYFEYQIIRKDTLIPSQLGPPTINYLCGI